ncbi:MAG TPA: hypothetical protein VE420_08770 [Gemmatimonadales bacterium]|nr:hypothetical protein [Gemmatimonadales bacterium]
MKRGLVMFVLVLLVGTGGPTDIRAQEATPVTGADLGELVLPPDAPAYGLTYEAWTARFAQWAHSLPLAIHPAADPTGALCGLGQAGPVFFLVQAGGQDAVERTCTVPAGTALLLPLLSASCTTVEPPPFHGRDEAALRACTEAWFATAVELTAVVDGETIPDLERYRVQSDLFAVALPAGNMLGVEPTVTQGVADGYWLLLAPLPVGEHELHFGGSVPDSDIASEVTYHLTVAEPTVLEPTDGALEATPTA